MCRVDRGKKRSHRNEFSTTTRPVAARKYQKWYVSNVPCIMRRSEFGSPSNIIASSRSRSRLVIVVVYGRTLLSRLAGKVARSFKRPRECLSLLFSYNNGSYRKGSRVPDTALKTFRAQRLYRTVGRNPETYLPDVSSDA